MYVGAPLPSSYKLWLAQACFLGVVFPIMQYMTARTDRIGTVSSSPSSQQGQGKLGTDRLTGLFIHQAATERDRH